MLVYSGSGFINRTPDYVQVRQRSIVRLCPDRNPAWFAGTVPVSICASADCLQLVERDTQALAPQIDFGPLAVYRQQVTLETQRADGDTRSDGRWYDCLSVWVIRC